MKNITKSCLIAAGLCLATAGFANGLKLCQSGYQYQIDVSCNGTAGIPIPANGCAHVGPINVLPWSTLDHDFGKSAQCTFTSDNDKTVLGKATLTVSADDSQGEVSTPTNVPASFKITADQPYGQFANDISVNIAYTG